MKSDSRCILEAEPTSLGDSDRETGEDGQGGGDQVLQRTPFLDGQLGSVTETAQLQTAVCIVINSLGGDSALPIKTYRANLSVTILKWRTSGKIRCRNKNHQFRQTFFTKNTV